MRVRTPGVAVMLVALIACSCVESTAPGPRVTGPVPAAPASPAPPASPAAVASLSIDELQPTMIPGTFASIIATPRGSDGTALVRREVDWSSSDPTVVSVSPTLREGGYPNPGGPGSLQAIAPGKAIITATVGGRTASVTLSVVEPSAEGFLRVDEFFMIEIEFGGVASSNYAPQLRLTESTGARTAAVIRIDLSIPGLGPFPGSYASIPFGPGMSRDIYQEVYGHYQVVLGGSRRVAPGTLATARITVRNDDGTVAFVIASGPIVPGGLPAPYTGDSPFSRFYP